MTSDSIDRFPLQFARTRRFSLGVPQQFSVDPEGDRVLFTRSVSGTDPRGLLWLHEHGGERLLSGDEAVGPGVTGYAADRALRVVAYTVGGALWTVRTDGGGPRLIPTGAAVADPRPSPDGALIGYTAPGGALRVVGADGTGDRPLLEPEGPDVTYGQADSIARGSIGRSRGYWWSPDSRALLVARVASSKVHRRHIADPADPARPPRSVPYPAAGTPNAETSLHLVTVDGRRTPVRLPRSAPDSAGAPPLRQEWTDPAFEYLVTAGWDHGSPGPVVSLQTRDQRTLWILAVDPATGAVRTLSRHTDPHWVEPMPGTPLHTDAGIPVLPAVRGDARAIRVGDTLSPAGLQVRAVLGAVGEQVLFTATPDQDPTVVQVWSHRPDSGFARVTDEPGVHTATAGGDTVVLDSRTESGQTVTVLRRGRAAGRIAVLAEEPLVVPRPIHLTLGARELRSRLHLPSWYRGQQRLPVLLSPYGGPGMQVVTRARGWYTAVCQWFAEQGFAVLATDGRGTPGRGVEWQRAILGDRLLPVLEDQIDALHAAAADCDALDLGRVGIRGWSFSGYLAAGAVLHRPDVFHAAVAGAPPTDRRLYNSYWEERFLGHPDVRPDVYEHNSLLPYADRLTRPLMLVHGLADENVFPVHSLRLSAALLAAGRPHTLLPLPGVGHVVAGTGVADTLLRAESDFLKRSLGSTG